MGKKSYIGVCFCAIKNGNLDSLDPTKLIAFTKSISSVKQIWDPSDLNLASPEALASTIRDHNLDRIVIAGKNPGELKSIFIRAMALSGNDPRNVSLLSFDEYGCTSKHDTAYAQAILASVIDGVSIDTLISDGMVMINTNALVIGGGIAGIQAALEIANGGYKVFLVEQSPTIGGHMAMFDKTFPTLDCAACILTPKMVEVGQHQNIELLTLSEVIDLSGSPGNYTVKIKKKARYVTDKCTGCGECTKVCPVDVPSEFESGLVNRKAIYRNFPQAIPNTYAISRAGNPHCKITCPIGQDVEGYLLLTSRGMFKEAHELIRRTNALPSVCGRVCYHTCEAACKRAHLDEPVAIKNIKRYITEKYSSEEIQLTKDKYTGKKIAIVGAGPSGLACAHDLTLRGHDVTIFEKQARAGGMLISGIPEFRLPRDVLDADIEFIEKLGVSIKLNSPVGTKVDFAKLKQDFDAIYIATGAHKSLDIGLSNEDTQGILHGVDFLRKVNLGEDIKIGERVLVIGGGNTAIDSARVAIRMGAKQVDIIYRRSMKEMPATKEEVEAARDEGVKIRLLASPKEFIVHDGSVQEVRFARMKLGEPDESGRRRPIEKEGEDFIHEADTVIIAVSQRPELNYIDEEIIGISKWNTLVVNDTTLSANVPGFFAGGDAVSGPASVVEAMGMGKRAAMAIDNYLNVKPLDAGMEVFDMGEVPQLSPHEISELKQKHKIEPRKQQREIGIHERKTTFHEVEQTYTDEEAIAEAKRCLNCTVCSICRECEKVCDPKAIDYDMKDEVLELEVGNIVVATGFKPFDARRIEEYGYGKFLNTFTSIEFERMANASGPTNGNIVLRQKDELGNWFVSAEGVKPKSIAIIHCIGNRNLNFNEYCSTVCCMYSLKMAHLVKEKLPEAEVYEFYIDMRAFGKGYEEFYERIKEEGIHLVRGRPAKIEENNGQLHVRCEDIINKRLIEQNVDMVILSVGMEARSDAESMAKILGVTRGNAGWFNEANYNSDPVNTFRGGIRIAGVCQGPKDIPDSVAQGSAAAARVLQSMLKGKIENSINELTLEDVRSSIQE